MLYQTFFPRILSVLVVLPALALTACDPMTAQPTVAARPVLVTNAHYESQVSERSFVGTIRPRIESDLGFQGARQGCQTFGRGRHFGRGRPAVGATR